MIGTLPLVVVVFLNELTLPALLWHVLMRRSVFFVEVLPIAAFTGNVSIRIARRFARSIYDLHPSLAAYHERRTLRNLNNAFARIEPWMNRRFGFSESDHRLGDDAFPYRQTVCNAVLRYIAPVWLLDQIANVPGNAPLVIAPTPLLQEIYTAFHGGTPRLTISVPWSAQACFKFLLGLAFRALAVIKAVKGLRGIESRQRFTLASDFHSTSYDRAIWESIGDTIVVFRNHSGKKQAAADFPEFASTSWGEGGFGIKSAVRATREAWWRIGRLRRGDVNWDPMLFWRVIALPLKQLDIRKLLASYSFKFFWARDDYNEDHILRTQELRRQGCLSLGASHALPIAATVVPMWRYIDFDRYYVMGDGLCDHYADTWSRRMKVVAVGSRGMTRERADQLSMPRSKMILFQCKPWRMVDPLVETVRSLALRFADHKILVQIKGSFRTNSLAREFCVRAVQGLGNITIVEDNIYDLMLHTRVLVTDPSTVAAEAIQFGVAAFVLDAEGQQSLYFRNYPDLTYTDPTALVERVAAFVEGSWQYPWDSMDRLVRREPVPYVDAILADLERATGHRVAAK